MALSVLQLLLLENLTYTYSSAFPFNYIQSYEGQTVADYLGIIRNEELAGLGDLGSAMTGDDWLKMFAAIREDRRLMSMEIAAAHRDRAPGGGGGFSVLFLDRESREAVVAFKGTQGNAEWSDNFRGAAATDEEDGVSTGQQLNALAWYREIYEEFGLAECTVTVTGHSKGGNKAKYLALMDDTVDRCVSFDGQGFSDDFVLRYAHRIRARRDIIENHNVDRDFVNILINDVGKISFYQGFEVGNGGLGFLENHCPNTFFLFSEGAPVTMIPAACGRAAGMEEVDRFLNSLVRSIPTEKQRLLAELMCGFVTGAQGDAMTAVRTETDGSGEAGEAPVTDKLDYYVDLITCPEYRECSVYLVAYTLKYLNSRPELPAEVLALIRYYGLERFRLLLVALAFILSSTFFEAVLKGTVKAAAYLPTFILNQAAAALLRIAHLSLPGSRILPLIALLADVPATMDAITYLPGGRDLTN